MEKFSNDPIENMAINALDRYDKAKRIRLTISQPIILSYIKYDKKWRWELLNGPSSKKLNWADEGVKEKIIKFLIGVKPELEREFLRAKSELDLTKKTVSAL